MIPELVDNITERHEVDYGSEMTLPCQEKGALPQPEVKWFVMKAPSKANVSTVNKKKNISTLTKFF